MRFQTISLVIGSLCLIGTAHAATEIRAKAEGHDQKIAIDGDNVRMQFDNNKSYILFNTNTKESYVVDPDRKTAIHVDVKQAQAFMQSSNNGQAQSVKVDKVGAGPNIAGFATTQYKMTVDSKSCGDLYIAENVDQNKELKQWFEAGREAQAANSIKTSNNPCDSYSPQIQSEIMKHGLPFKRVDASGKTVYEILSIDPKSPLTAADFQVPNGYQVQDTAAMMEKMQGLLKQNGGAGNGGLDPDMLKKLQGSQGQDQTQKLLEQLKKQQGQ